MVRLSSVLLVSVVVGLSACSSQQKQSVVAIDSSKQGVMAKGTTKDSVTPTPKVVFTLLAKSESAKNESNLAGALRYLDQAQRLAPDEPRIYLQYGEIYLQQNRSNLAVSMFKKVLSIVPSESRLGEMAAGYLQDLVP